MVISVTREHKETKKNEHGLAPLRATLLAINAKYVHSSLAVRFLAAGTAMYSKTKHNISVMESTINQDMNDIAELVYRGNPDLIGISTYIWNAGMLPDLLNLIRRRLPFVKIVLGGPEASYNPEYWLRSGADYVLRGEGEHSFPALLDTLSGNKAEKLQGISGLCYRENGKLNINGLTSLPDEYLDPYDDEYLAALNGRIAYIEASRGCPFRCTYCLSGSPAHKSGNRVRFFPLDAVKKQIDMLSKSGTQTVKFVDRTFNCNPERAFDIFEYVIGLNTGCCFHFEAAADLFDERTISLLGTAAPGRIQLEIGLQSFHMPALDAVSRKTDPEKAEKAIKKLLSPQNIHVHIDLIAGLPLETLSDFKDSFDRAYALKAHTLQLGFLKLLHGSALRAQAEALGIVYQNEPPYEITSSSWLSEHELSILKHTENALQHTYNKSRFLSVLQYVLTVSGMRPFELFYGLGAAAPSHASPLKDYAAKVYNYCAGLPNVKERELRDLMICDILGATKGKSMPDFLKGRGEKRKSAANTANRLLGRTTDYDESAVLSSGRGVCVDSVNRHPVTGLYGLIFFRI